MPRSEKMTAQASELAKYLVELHNNRLSTETCLRDPVEC